MKTFIMNIGLETSKRFNTNTGVLEISAVIEKLKQLPFISLSSYKIETSTSEETVVAYFTYDGTAPLDKQVLTEAIKNLSDKLHQDCVAFYNVADDTGVLIGEFASMWGGFNLDYFIK